MSLLCIYGNYYNIIKFVVQTAVSYVCTISFCLNPKKQWSVLYKTNPAGALLQDVVTTVMFEGIA